MFTGIIEETGIIRSIYSQGEFATLRIACSKVLGEPGEPKTKLGDSIAVNGICLTVTNLYPDGFTADVMPETLRRSALGKLGTGSTVNLERALAANGRFGGHIVSGHIDGTGTIQSMQEDGNAIWIEIAIPESMAPYIVEKGSITIDGISLTVADVSKNSQGYNFAVSIIPHTLKETSLSQRKPGDMVNLETDIIGKYVESLLSFTTKSTTSYSQEQEAKDRKLEELLRNF